MSSTYTWLYDCGSSFHPSIIYAHSFPFRVTGVSWDLSSDHSGQVTSSMCWIFTIPDSCDENIFLHEHTPHNMKIWTSPRTVTMRELRLKLPPLSRNVSLTALLHSSGIHCLDLNFCHIIFQILPFYYIFVVLNHFENL